MKRLYTLVLVTTLCALVLTAAGCSELSLEEVSGNGSGTETGSGGAQATPRPSSPEQAAQMLGELTVSETGSMSGYSREKFPHWAEDTEAFGWQVPDGSCDVRDAALLRDGRDATVNEDCSFTSGQWPDPYTGETFIDSSDLDIDHVVPLANAWRSGADKWSASEREDYANGSYEVLSVDDGANQQKGDKGPEAWRPPNADYHCQYAYRWIGIKISWVLTITSVEKSALEEMLGTCQTGD